MFSWPGEQLGDKCSCAGSGDYEVIFPQVALLCPQSCKTDEQGCKDPCCLAILSYVTSYKHGRQRVRGPLIFKDSRTCRNACIEMHMYDVALAKLFGS